MKKFIFYLLIFTFCLSFIDIVLALEKTYERTRDNLLVPDGITVNDDNIDAILNTKAVDAEDKIYDYANLFTAKEEEKLLKKVKLFIEDSSLDLVIITENKNLGSAAASYAFNFYDYNFFKKNGLIFLIDKADNKFNIYMWTSGDTYDIYTSKKIESILKYTYTFFDEGKYYKGANDFVEVVHSFYIASKKGDLVKIDKSGKVVKTVPWVDLFVLASALTFIIVFLTFFKKKKGTSRRKYDDYLDKDNMRVELEEDIFLGKNVIKK